MTPASARPRKSRLRLQSAPVHQRREFGIQVGAQKRGSRFWIGKGGPEELVVRLVDVFLGHADTGAWKNPPRPEPDSHGAPLTRAAIKKTKPRPRVTDRRALQSGCKLIQTATPHRVFEKTLQAGEILNTAELLLQGCRNFTKSTSAAFYANASRINFIPHHSRKFRSTMPVFENDTVPRGLSRLPAAEPSLLQRHFLRMSCLFLWHRHFRAHTQIQHFNRKRKCHGEINIPLRDMLPHSFRNQHQPHHQ